MPVPAGESAALERGRAARLPATLALFFAIAVSAGALSAQSFAEFKIPTDNSQPSSLALGPDGNLWFTEYGSNKIGRITPAGVITEFAVPYSAAEAPPSLPKGFPFPIPDNYSGPIYIYEGPDGAMWFTEPGVNKIGRITMAGVITEFKVPTRSSLPAVISDGPDGALWFTEAAGNKIGRITTSGVITEFPIPTPESLPIYITDGPDGNLWFTESNANKIGRITPNGQITEFEIPTLLSLPADITEGPDEALWFTELIGGKIGKITTDGKITEFPVPSLLGLPANITEAGDGNVWFTETRGNRINRMTPAGAVTSFAVPTAGSSPVAIEEGSDGKIWFTEAGSGIIGRFDPAGGPTACVQSANALCLNNSRFQFKVTWRIPFPAANGNATAVPLTGETGNFWFFASGAMDLTVKILDGRAFNNRFWVYIGGLTNVEYTVTVTDTATGKVKTYTNPFGQVASIADVLAF